MAEASDFKSRVSRQSVRRLARCLAAVDPTLETRELVRAASAGLEELELKARITHVADTLERFLPRPYPRAAKLIRAAVARVEQEDSSVFVFWPLATFIERHGLSHFDESFRAMHDLTSLASCEFAVRPFVEAEPSNTFEVLGGWTRATDPHVRRLVSEGTRPRLPWGARLRALQADPSPSITLLDRLFDDPELYVRRSVANHLNDISKDHPDLAVAVAARWKKEVSGRGDSDVADATDWVVRHGLRSLVKRGHGGALELQGFGPAKAKVSAFSVSPRRVRFGSPLALHLELEAKAAGEWMIDYAVHHMKANGKLSPKVFKWTRRQVRRGETIVLDKSHPIRAISTRVYYPGQHRCEVLVNGKSVAIEDFTLVGVC